MNKKAITIWEGIYQSFSEIPDQDSAFKDTIWKDKLIHRLHSDLSGFNEKASISKITLTPDYPLPLLTAILVADKPQVKILDFGGGLASLYFKILASIPNHKKDAIQYHIVEFEETCALGEDSLGDYPNIFFHSSPPNSESFDIVHLGSTLQYIEDWLGLIQSFAPYNHTYLVLSDLMAGDIPSFDSTQEYYGKKLKTHFWNVNELIHALEKLNYQEIYRCLYLGTFFGEKGPLPMDNLPETHQLPHACHLIFRR